MPTSPRTSRRMPGFSLLLAGMFGELMIAPLFGKSGGGLGPARAITAVMLLAALSVVGVGRAALVLFIGAMITHGLTSFSSASFVVVAAATSRFVFLCYVLGVVLWHVSMDPEV